jgi:hypothetical protein
MSSLEARSSRRASARGVVRASELPLGMDALCVGPYGNLLPEHVRRNRRAIVQTLGGQEAVQAARMGLFQNGIAFFLAAAAPQPAEEKPCSEEKDQPERRRSAANEFAA